MIVELISTGSEILLGDLVNTNVSWLSQELNKYGYSVMYQTSVGDNLERIADVFKRASERADIIISTGGLGPTQGDITRQSLAEALSLPLECNAEALKDVQNYFGARNREFPAPSLREAQLPKGAVPLHNPVGVAPGVSLVYEGKIYILLPGPPSEMKGTFSEAVLPYLDKTFGPQGCIKSYRYAVYGIREITLEEMLMDLIKTQKNPTIAMLIKAGYIELRITAKGNTEEEALTLLAPWDKIIHDRLGAAIGRNLNQSLEEVLARVLWGKKLTVATAESCTGGLVGKRLTELAGSSEYYMGGIISYSNEVKHQVLGVPQNLLDTYGAVSEQVAKAMAEGVRDVMGTDFAVSTTGIAGPGGATPTKPVGLVYMAVAGPKGTRVYKENYISDRGGVRYGASESILNYLYQYAKED